MKYWQDNYIIEKGNEFETFDEKGEPISKYDTLKEARDSLTSYALQLNGNYGLEDSPILK